MNGDTGRPAPVVGAYVVDVRDGRIGQVMGREGGYVQLRPVGGGREWDCPPERLGEAAPRDVLRERVRRLNREARLP
ncbi:MULTISPECIES: hypothetical protein [Streptomyces]|uniref:hypothetical protein n=1 Tax=Streptomyces TaxID=1883 RepID=UPI000F73E42A|nr:MULTISPECIES: hypothetical protein [Streptomyces]MCM3264917.1 hypothetical protein [Streptomyces thermoviolaceus]RSR96358.1 hypothetical protein EF917_23750 [Streptomyces sp. WAC00469]GGV69533.1 hypothetical protein GCM10010499_18230 [Streptomyces thermoviolaceus subsp. apingens]GHB05143.1 hypothetical protein GCM10010512_40820 [Streptomyces thermoviolaceus subsp. thermoviolaceus]